LDTDLVVGAAGQKPEPEVHKSFTEGNPDTKVWVNTRSGTYDCPGTRWYGKTKEGEYLTQTEAQDKGYGRKTLPGGLDWRQSGVYSQLPGDQKTNSGLNMR
jgi:hypothetical protein